MLLGSSSLSEFMHKLNTVKNCQNIAYLVHNLTRTVTKSTVRNMIFIFILLLSDTTDQVVI